MRTFLVHRVLFLRRTATVSVVGLLLLLLSVRVVHSDVVTQRTQRLGRATYRVHYDYDSTTTPADEPCRSNLIVVGVGTAMTVSQYDGLAQTMAAYNPNAVVAIVNPTVTSPFKFNPVTLNAKPFAKAFNKVVAKLVTQQEESSSSSSLVSFTDDSRRTLIRWRTRTGDFQPGVRLCPLPPPPPTMTTPTSGPDNNSSTGSSLQVIVGGHSATGGAAFYALLNNLFSFEVAGYMGWDPYPIRAQAAPINVPGLHWGFSTTTCMVTASESAAASFQRTLANRSVFYQLQNNNNNVAGSNNTCNTMTYCIFSDTGCPFCRNQGCTGSRTIHSAAFHDIALSVQQFVLALGNSTSSSFDESMFPTSNFQINRQQYRIYPFDDDTINVSSSSSARIAKDGGMGL